MILFVNKIKKKTLLSALGFRQTFLVLLMFNFFYVNAASQDHLISNQSDTNSLENHEATLFGNKSINQVPSIRENLSFTIDTTKVSSIDNTKYSFTNIKEAQQPRETSVPIDFSTMTPQEALLTEQDPYGRNSIMLAASIGNAGAAKSILLATYKQPDLLASILSQKDIAQQSVFIIAAAHGHPDIVTDILQATAYYPDLQTVVLMQQEQLGNTGLMMATEGGNQKAVRAILQEIMPQPALLEIVLLQRNNAQLATFMIAAAAGHYELVNDILAATAPYPDLQKTIIAQKNAFGQNSLMLASLGGHNQVVDAILQAVAPITT